MVLEFGNGPTLKTACAWLQDDAQRYEQILDVTERNSVIEGLPPLEDQMKRRIRAQLAAIAGQSEAPDGSSPSSNGSRA